MYTFILESEAYNDTTHFFLNNRNFGNKPNSFNTFSNCFLIARVTVDFLLSPLSFHTEYKSSKATIIPMSICNHISILWGCFPSESGPEVTFRRTNSHTGIASLGLPAHEVCWLKCDSNLPPTCLGKQICLQQDMQILNSALCIKDSRYGILISDRSGRLIDGWGEFKNPFGKPSGLSLLKPLLGTPESNNCGFCYPN